MPTEKKPEQAAAPAAADQQQQVSGRSVFMVETSPAGIVVRTALLTEEGKLMNMPAVFPDVEYAFAQIDELRRLVSRHFSQAAQIGGQVIAQQTAAQQAGTTSDQKDGKEVKPSKLN